MTSTIFVILALAFFTLTPTVLAVPTPDNLVGDVLGVADGVVNAGIDLTTINDPPPIGLQTTVHSPECAAINGGQLVCCADQVNGDIPEIQFLAELFSFPINPNGVNGIGCNTQTQCGPTTTLPLCCQVTALIDRVPAVGLGMWCQNLPADQLALVSPSY